MDLLQRFRDFIHRENLFHPSDKLLLAVSGGVDSVVLCELCKQAGFDFAIAHCNFQLRGEESERDENFVRELAKKYGVKVLVKKFDTENYATENKIGIQEAARDLRYNWFKELITYQSSIPDQPHTGSDDSQARSHVSGLKLHVLTAHHADDNIETALMNFFRGTGLHGLRGIPASSDHLKRPLINFWKEELMEFASANRLAYVEDSSNESSKYTRNFFRNEIIPLITKAYPQVKSNLKDNIHRFGEIQKLYDVAVNELKGKLCKRKNDEVHIPIKQLMSYQNEALIFEIISPFGFAEKQIDEVVKLAEAESGKFIQSAAYRIIKFRNWFIIASNSSANSETIVIEEGTKNVQCSMFNVQFSMLENSDLKISALKSIACLDAREIRYPLILRRWKQGDYFYPLGMPKKKKLARFFIDQKLSKTEKEKVWVLEMNKKILWVVGMRIDDRFKVTDKTKSILKISLEAS